MPKKVSSVLYIPTPAADLSSVSRCISLIVNYVDFTLVSVSTVLLQEVSLYTVGETLPVKSHVEDELQEEVCADQPHVDTQGTAVS